MLPVLIDLPSQALWGVAPMPERRRRCSATVSPRALVAGSLARLPTLPVNSG